MDAFAPDEAVVPVIVAVVLVGFPGALRLGVVVAAGGGAVERRGRGEDRGALFKIEGDVALEMDRVAGIGVRGKEHGAAAGGCGCFDRAVDRRAVDCLSVTPSAERLDVQDARTRKRFVSVRGSGCRLG